jgi:catechol 2,3-dioxygenase-like lactoylglutathione lyase family enzyme
MHGDGRAAACAGAPVERRPIVKLQLEHANLEVRDVDAMVQFLRAAFPGFRVRGAGRTGHGTRWVHVGDDDTYVALQQAHRQPAEPWVPYSGKPGTNHLGYEVDDVAALRARLAAAGYRESTVPNDHPHRRRVYFYDPEGNDWEFVQYLSQDPALRNDYQVPDR